MHLLPDRLPADIKLSYEAAIAFWFGCINYERRSPQPDDLKLEAMKLLLDRLGNPQENLRILHVAGSKGKGSTAAMLAAILCQAGFRTGLFTSPHLCNVEERIQVNGFPIRRDDLALLLGEIQAVIEDLRKTAQHADFSPTFFEVATALGFLHFRRSKVDWTVVEVGLGGRLDSTNVCLPEVALITSISFDHVRVLGNRLAEIAREKAGIVKPGRPVASGVIIPEARTVIETICRERQAPLRQLGADFRYEYHPAVLDSRDAPAAGGRCAVDGRDQRRRWQFGQPALVQIQTGQRWWPMMELGLLGEHQAANAAVAIACVEELRHAGWDIPDSAVAKGLAEISWPARLEVLSRSPWVVLDCAHNVASAQALVAAIQQSFPPGRRLLVFASSNDKDIGGMFDVFVPFFSKLFLTQYGNSRSVAPGELARILTRSSATPYVVCPTAVDAWRAAREEATTTDLVCVAGSVFLAGELRPVLLSELGSSGPDRSGCGTAALSL
jgi:dihydrofolate synthase/folylpolyglutamate synthase